MAGEFTRSRSRAGHAGIFGSALALLGAIIGFVESRLALVAAESKTALIQLALAAICLVAAIMLLGFGYIFLIASAIVATAHLLQVSWLWTALIAAGLHFILALILLLIFRSAVTKPLFRETAAELKEDREWLRQIGATNRRPS
jgi:uncharacterized membrane protein YqjE